MKISEITLIESAINSGTTFNHILSAMERSGKCLYHGSKTFIPDATLKSQVYKTELRAQKVQAGKTDTPKHVNEIANKIFVEKFGVPFRYGMFCTSNLVNARFYSGDKGTCMIFPADGFYFCYSPVIKDFFDKMANIAIDDVQSLTKEQVYRGLYGREQEFRYKAGKSSDISLLAEALASGNEIMLYPGPTQGNEFPFIYTSQFHFFNSIQPKLVAGSSLEEIYRNQ